MVILFTGGGTGGHIFPCVAIKKEMEKILNAYLPNIAPQFRFLFTGRVIKEELKAADIKCTRIVEVKWRRYFSFKNFLDILKTPLLFLQTALYLWFFMPDLIFSKGGPSSWAAVFIGWLCRIPAIIHESDIIPGASNKISSIFSKKILISFEETKKFFPKKKVEFTGHPLREKLINPPKNPRRIFNLEGTRKVLLFMGGSQGAQQINELFIETIYKYLAHFEIIHICGPENFKELNILSRGLLDEKQRRYYHLYPYLDEERLSAAISIADFIITRAGAGTIFEIAALGKPSLIIPLESSAKDHQSKNAYFFKKKGAAIVIEGENVKANFVFERVRQVLEEKRLLQNLSKNAQGLSKKEATQKVAKILLETI